MTGPSKTSIGRPSLRQFIHLYANVAATALVAEGLDDLDLAEFGGQGRDGAVQAARRPGLTRA